ATLTNQKDFVADIQVPPPPLKVIVEPPKPLIAEEFIRAAESVEGGYEDAHLRYTPGRALPNEYYENLPAVVYKPPPREPEPAKEVMVPIPMMPTVTAQQQNEILSWQNEKPHGKSQPT